eukprot:417127-Amphidinium_carterae.1
MNNRPCLRFPEATATLAQDMVAAATPDVTVPTQVFLSDLPVPAAIHGEVLHPDVATSQASSVAPKTAGKTYPPAVSAACANSGPWSLQDENLPDHDASSDKFLQADSVDEQLGRQLYRLLLYRQRYI